MGINLDRVATALCASCSNTEKHGLNKAFGSAHDHSVQAVVDEHSMSHGTLDSSPSVFRPR